MESHRMESSVTKCMACGCVVDAELLGGVCASCLLDDVMSGAEKSKGDNFDGHELLGEIARGGMGVVYRARQHDPERMVALKTLRAASLDSPEAMARFKHETEVMVALDHPAILPVYHSGEMDGIPFFTMKLVEGGTLAERIENFAGKWREIAKLMATVCDGVRHAHERGVLHRDLKPGNILFDTAGQAYVSDFGIAKLADSQNAGLTLTMSVMGTPHYLAPEIAAGSVKAASVSSDVWSLGVILFELLTGEKPFKGESVTMVLRALDTSDTPAPSRLREDVPRDLEVITLKALSREPARRYTSALAFADDLRAWLEGRPITARAVPASERAWMWARRNPRLAATAALLVLAVLAAAASLVWGFVRVKQENERVVASEAETRAQLRESLLHQAHAGRLAREMGWRAAGLKALGEAYAIKPGDDARDEAVAHLAGFDLELGGRRFDGNVFPSPTMDRYVQVASDGAVAVRRMEDDVELFRLPSMRNLSQLSVVFDPRGRWLAVSVVEGTRIFSMEDHRELAHWPGAIVHRASDDGEFLPAEEKDRWVLWRTSDWSVAGEIKRGAFGRAWTEFRSHPQPGSEPLLATRLQRGLSLVNWHTASHMRQIEPVGLPGNYAWLGDQLVVNCGNDLGQSFDVRRGRSVLLPQFATPNLFFGNSGSVLMLSSGLDGVTQLWHLPTGARLVKGRGINVRQFGTDDRRFVTAGPGCTEGAVVRPSCVRLLADRRMTGPVGMSGRSMALSRDGRLFVIHDGVRVSVHEAASGRLIAHQEQAGMRCPVFSPDGRELWLVHVRGVSALKLTREDSKLTLVPDRELPAPEAGDVIIATPLPGGDGVLVEMQGGGIYEMRMETAQWRRWTGPAGARAGMFAISSDGRWIAGIPAGTPALYEASAPTVRRSIGSGKLAGRASFSPDSKRMVFIDMRHQWSVFEAPGWQPVASSEKSGGTAWTNTLGPALEAAWSPDGSWFAAVCDGTDIHLVEAGTWRTMARLHGPLELPVSSMIVGADGSSLIVQRRDGPVEIWDLRKLDEEMRALGIEPRLPPAIMPPPTPPDLTGPFEEAALPPLVFEEGRGAK